MFKVLKPARKGLKVFNPATKLHLPDEGLEVELSTYWRRLLIAGDVVEEANIYSKHERSEQVAGYDPGHQYESVVDEQAGETFKEPSKNKSKSKTKVEVSK